MTRTQKVADCRQEHLMEILVLRKADYPLHRLPFLQPTIAFSKPKQQKKVFIKIAPTQARTGNIAVKA